MLKIYLLISIITSMSFAQKMTLDVRDYFTEKPIILDSINIKNTILGIDTTVANPKIIDFTELFIINSVQSKRYFDISLNNNQLVVSSNERIENIKMFDLLGREVINANVNNTNYQTNINSENNSLFYFISIRTDKGLYNSKLINSTYENLQIANVMPTSSNWKITLYKFGYYTETIEYPTLPTIIKSSLKRIPILGKFKITMDNLVSYHSQTDDEPWNDEKTNYSIPKFYIDFDFNLNIFSEEKKIELDNDDFQFYECGYSLMIADYISYIKPTKSASFPGSSSLLWLTYWYYFIVNDSTHTASIFIGIEKMYEPDEQIHLTYDIVCMKFNLDNFNLNDLYRGTNDLISYDLSKTPQEISFYLTDKTNLGPSNYETLDIKMTDSTKTTGTITFELEK